MRVEALAKARDDADAGDPDFARVSHGREPPWGTRSRSATFSMLARNDGSGNSTRRKVSSALQTGLPSHLMLGLRHREARAVMHEARRHGEHLSGRHEGAQLCFLHGGEERHAGELVHGDQQPAGGLRHRLDQQDAGHQRMAGKVPFEDRGCGRDGRLGADRLVAELEFDNPVDEEKVLEAHAIPITLAPRPWRRSARRCARRGSSARNTARSSPCRR